MDILTSLIKDLENPTLHAAVHEALLLKGMATEGGSVHIIPSPTVSFQEIVAELAALPLPAPRPITEAEAELMDERHRVLSPTLRIQRVTIPAQPDGEKLIRALENLDRRAAERAAEQSDAG